MEPVVFPEPVASWVGLVGMAAIAYVFVELAILQFRLRTLRLREARTATLGIASVALVGALVPRFLGPVGIGAFAVVGASLSPLDSFGLGPVGWLYGGLVYEFWYWVQHWAAHKVRLLWCLHSPHHAPESLHMLIGANHHFLESVFYMPFFAGFAPALLGVDPLVCLAINLLDSVWGSFLHISDDVVRDGRYGIVGRFMQTPAHHRVHHAKNVRYLDRNYCSITLFWDWAFGTLEPLRTEEPVEYGITRDVDPASFWDVHFGEFVLLAKDVWHADRWSDRLGYLFRAPGWRPGDASATADARRHALLSSADSRPGFSLAAGRSTRGTAIVERPPGGPPCP